MHKHGQFSQYLEGPDDQLETWLARMSAGPCHSDISVLFRETATVRRFPEWTMGYKIVTDTRGRDPGLPGRLRIPFAPGPASSGLSVAVGQLVAWFQARSLISV